MCSEEDPAVCHRHLLVGRVLAGEGLTLRHIRGDGRLQTDADLAQAQKLITQTFANVRERLSSRQP